MLLIFDLI